MPDRPDQGGGFLDPQAGGACFGDSPGGEPAIVEPAALTRSSWKGPLRPDEFARWGEVAPAFGLELIGLPLPV
jgi:hypothetical protein